MLWLLVIFQLIFDNYPLSIIINLILIILVNLFPIFDFFIIHWINFGFNLVIIDLVLNSYNLK